MKITLQVRAKNALLLAGLRQLGWTQKELAVRLTCETDRIIYGSMVSDWVCLRDYPRNEGVRRYLADLLGCDEWTLFPNMARDQRFLEAPKSIEREAEVLALPSADGDQADYRLITGNGHSVAAWLPGNQAIERTVESAELREHLQAAFQKHLRERERKILYLYFGLDGQGTLTYEEIGKQLGVTRERIVQIVQRALGKLRGLTVWSEHSQ